MRKALWLMAVLVAVGTACVADELPAKAGDDSKTADIRRLLEVTGTARVGIQVINTVGDSLKRAFPKVPEAAWAELMAEFKADDLAELAVPIYAKHLSGEEVRGLLAFYESPLGQKLIAVQPQILQESMEAGRIWGEACARRVLKRLEEKGYSGKTAGD